jgi:hypothetical protein
VFGPQPVQNPSIETVVLRISRDKDGNPSKLVIQTVIAGTNPPVPSNEVPLSPPDPDFRALVEKLLLK